ncbi:hypothetical protein WJX72_007605 [[Myrmecia] bisecta]|uniref:Tubulin--tyrosine ligase-like protein 5 n=1 Tax=[Myrmecia] bisecta TaxID=41462 RepID=A0AAW1QFP8_9CHLO
MPEQALTTLNISGEVPAIMAADHDTGIQQQGSAAQPQAFNWVLQRHIDQPLLIDGHKFHLHTYTLTISGRTFIYDECFVCFASKPYDSARLKDREAHITNYTANKRAASFKPCSMAFEHVELAGIMPQVRALREQASNAAILTGFRSQHGCTALHLAVAAANERWASTRDTQTAHAVKGNLEPEVGPNQGTATPQPTCWTSRAAICWISGTTTE